MNWLLCRWMNKRKTPAKTLTNFHNLGDNMKNVVVHAQRKIAEYRAIICEKLGWSHLQYGQTQYDLGQAYLRQYLPDDPLGQNILLHSRVFWNWWKLRWIQVDEQFLCKYPLSNTGHSRLEDLYIHMHYTDVLTCKPYPGKLIEQESLDAFIHDLVTEKHALP